MTDTPLIYKRKAVLKVFNRQRLEALARDMRINNGHLMNRPDLETWIAAGWKSNMIHTHVLKLITSLE